VIWRSPGQEVAAVIAGTAFVCGDRVICSEWFGEGEPPFPRWRQACHMRDFDPTEQDFDLPMLGQACGSPTAAQIRASCSHERYRFVDSNGNSQAVKFIQPESSTVPAIPLVRITVLPTSSVRARLYSARMAEAWAFAVGMEPVITRLG
jgi:hypothetical protein